MAIRTFTPKKATRKGQHLRMAIDGPTGAGKTWTSLEVARELVGDEGTILLIDTEDGSSGLYGDIYDFDVVEFEAPYDPRDLRQAIKQFSKDYDCIIVDSLTHFWNGEGGVTDIVDRASKKMGNNKWAGWSEGTPAQRDMVEAITSAPCHIITTMRSKMETVMGEDGKVVKLGMSPEQRSGIEYEFTVVGDMDHQHAMTISKSRCDAVADKLYRKGHTIEVATTLRNWLDGNAAMIREDQVDTIKAETNRIKDRDDRTQIKEQFVEFFGRPSTLTEEEADKAIEWTVEAADAMVAKAEEEAKAAEQESAEDEFGDPVEGEVADAPDIALVGSDDSEAA